MRFRQKKGCDIMRSESISLNIPKVSTAAFVELLTKLYSSAVAAGGDLKALPTPFLWGPAGVGKSRGAYQLAKNIGEATGKRTSVTDVRLLLFSPVDLRGIPYADVEEKLAVWLKPKLFDMDASEDHINLLFLDELSAAPQSVQAAAYQICLDRKIGEFALPDNCIVIAAGNRTTDGSVAYKMPKALCNRLLHFDVVSDFEAWREWAVKNAVDSRVIAFIDLDHSRLCREPSSSELAYSTPRSWEFVSNLLKQTKGKPTEIYELIAGCVGCDIALEFIAFCKGTASIPSIPDVLAGRCTERPTGHDGLFAMSAGIIEAIRERGEAISVIELENACIYVIKNFPQDFTIAFMKDLKSLPGINLPLMKCQSFGRWLAKNKVSV